MDTLNAQPMYHSPEIRAVYARVRQLAHLATDAADHLIDAVDILDHTRAGLPVELGDDFLAVLTEQEARQRPAAASPSSPASPPWAPRTLWQPPNSSLPNVGAAASYPSTSRLPSPPRRAPRCARSPAATSRSPATSPTCAARTSASASAPSAPWKAAAW
ncbi:hypothetical protein O1L55_32575 [Streptomyces albulus]|nr:hypothetical protein [Streptomyces noursei]